MEVIRATQDIHVPKSPEMHSEDFAMYSPVYAGELALVADGYIDKLKEGSFEIYANVNPTFKRDKSGKKAKDELGN